MREKGHGIEGKRRGMNATTVTQLGLSEDRGQTRGRG